MQLKYLGFIPFIVFTGWLIFDMVLTTGGGYQKAVNILLTFWLIILGLIWALS